MEETKMNDTEALLNTMRIFQDLIVLMATGPLVLLIMEVIGGCIGYHAMKWYHNRKKNKTNR